MIKCRHPIVHSLSCTACGQSKENIFLELCPKCEQAMLRSFPLDYFKVTKKLNALEAECLTAFKVTEALSLEMMELPIKLTA